MIFMIQSNSFDKRATRMGHPGKIELSTYDLQVQLTDNYTTIVCVGMGDIGSIFAFVAITRCGGGNGNN